MAQISTESPLTLIELAKRTNNGTVLDIAEVLSEKNRIIEDAIWQEANKTTSHVISRRQAEPSGTWRKYNEKVTPSASQTKQVVEQMGMLEAYSEIDKELVKLASDPANFRRTEDLGFVGGLSKEFARALIYADQEAYPSQFDGLADRLNDLSQDNVLSEGGTGSDLTSLYIVKWDVTDGAFLLYPKNSASLGIEVEDLGEVTIGDDTNGYYQGYRTHFILHTGLAVRDTRGIGRLCNIESPGTGSNELESDSMVEILNEFLDLNNVVIYGNKNSITALDILAKDKTNVYYQPDMVWGKPTVHFRGVPVKRVDQIVSTEDEVT